MVFKSFSFIICVFLLTACGQSDSKHKVDWPIREDIVFTDQNNQLFELKDLKGKIWVTDFIFTSCSEICPLMTANLVKLQEMLKSKGIVNVQFVSFSVNPSVDSPHALTAFANRFNADGTNWTFLTGYSQEYIELFARNNFKALVKQTQGSGQVIHGTNFYLVGSDGRVKKYYNGVQNVPFAEIIKDIETLQ